MPRSTTRARKNLGESGERVAALFLEERGYKILERNFRTRGGEIDPATGKVREIRHSDVKHQTEVTVTVKKLVTALTPPLAVPPSSCTWKVKLA